MLKKRNSVSVVVVVVVCLGEMIAANQLFQGRLLISVPLTFRPLGNTWKFVKPTNSSQLSA